MRQHLLCNCMFRPSEPNSGCQDRLSSIQVCRGEELISQQLQAPHLGTTGIQRSRVSFSDARMMFSLVFKVLCTCAVPPQSQECKYWWKHANQCSCLLLVLTCVSDCYSKYWSKWGLLCFVI